MNEILRPVIVRPARLDDADQVWPLARDFGTSFTAHRESFDVSWPTLVAAPSTLVAVAQTPADTVVGYLLAHTHLTLLANGPVAWVEEVMVVEAQRRAGIGHALMDRAEHWATAQGAAYVALASRRAGPFYLALGYDDSAVFYRKPALTERDPGLRKLAGPCLDPGLAWAGRADR